MGRKGNKKGPLPGLTYGTNQGSMTLREQINGRKNHNKAAAAGGRGGGSGGSNNVRSVLKLKHLQNLALWAGGDASIPSLGALFGQRLASCGESMGIPLDPSLFPCQRCESILQPGCNCTVRIEKNGSKMKRRRKKSSIPPQNNVVYTCHFCSHRNVKRGTPKNHMKEILPSKPKPVAELKQVSSDKKCSSSAKTIASSSEIGKNAEEIISSELLLTVESVTKPVAELEQVCSDQKHSSSAKAITSSSEIGKDVEEIISSEFIPIVQSEASVTKMNPVIARDIPIEKSPATPVERVQMILSDGKRRKRNRSGCNKQVGTESNSATMDAEKATAGSSKRKRKSWSSLKEIAENSERKSSDVVNLTIPFLL
ncbi:RNAse P [Macleaya cordata]|uniref:RNAse P n=1 Tax=Macleaya cordata TaxID=56857 RepID=A0A200QUD7_MACCD|nr:RNAse P [Macleaya cordata]